MMKKFLCGVVMACVTAAAMPVSASELSAAVASDARASEGLRTSIERAVRTSSVSVTAPQQARLSRTAPRPDRGGDQTRKQMGGGGGKTGMIIGLVSAAAGAAATVYMIKAMKDSTKNASDN